MADEYGFCACSIEELTVSTGTPHTIDNFNSLSQLCIPALLRLSARRSADAPGGWEILVQQAPYISVSTRLTANSRQRWYKA